jgi:hypothetical protein
MTTSKDQSARDQPGWSLADNWIRRTDDDLYGDGDILLVACDVCGQWMFEVVVIRGDEDHLHIELQNGDNWDGDLSDIIFYVKVSRLSITLPKEI